MFKRKEIIINLPASDTSEGPAVWSDKDMQNALSQLGDAANKQLRKLWLSMFGAQLLSTTGALIVGFALAVKVLHSED